MPNVIMEAMARGMAVIATDVGATSVLVDDKTGWLIKDASPKHIIEALEMAYLSDPVETRQRRVNALRRMKADFVWEHIAERLKGLLEQRTIR
jgi:glycosyltransferase involved in cell wall biosynthesis